jgi:DNA-binding MarR family transcriptional regulator
MSGFNELIHAPQRLKICAALAPLDELEFQDIRKLLGVSDSVLSKHLKQLDEAGYISQRKATTLGKKTTWILLTEAGRQAFNAHVAALRAIVSEQ